MEFFQHIGIVRDIPGLDPDIVFRIWGYPIASSTLMTFFITIVIAIFVAVSVRRFRVNPGRFQIIIESLYEQVVGLIQQITASEKHAKRVFPIIGAMLVYLTIANLIGLIPGLSEFTYNGTPVFRSPTADFNTTFGLAFGAILVLQFVSIKDYGLFGHIGKFFKFKEVYQGFRKGVSAGFVALIDFFVGVLDIIGELAKIISLALRLFGNMYAGNVLMVIIMGALAYVLPAVWLGMNIFVGILQAMVFSALVAAYYMLAIKPEDEEES
jgi:F-type H+-transporting ATPase subunit a